MLGKYFFGMKGWRTCNISGINLGKRLQPVWESCVPYSRVANVTSFLWAKALTAFSNMVLIRLKSLPNSIARCHPKRLGWTAKNDNQGLIKKSRSLNWLYLFFNLLRVCHRTLKAGIFLPTYLPFGLVVIKTLFITSIVHLTAGKFMAQLAYKSLQFCEFQHLLK